MRGNSRGVDLNRDFPDPFERGPAGVERPSGTEQPETRAAMDWIRSGRFVASGSLHEVRSCCLSLAWGASFFGEEAGVHGFCLTLRGSKQAHSPIAKADLQYSRSVSLPACSRRPHVNSAAQQACSLRPGFLDLVPQFQGRPGSALQATDACCVCLSWCLQGPSC